LGGRLYSGADSYIVLQPNDVATFQSLVEHPVEKVESQLLQSCVYYQRSSSLRVTQDDFTGVTRIILSSLSMGTATLKISELLTVYKPTLLSG